MHRFGRAGTLSRLKRSSCLPVTRSVHTSKKLPYDIDKGLGDFLPPPALKVVGHDYQNGLLDRLNEEVQGTEMQDQGIVQTIVTAASDRSRVLAFNYASLALNNNFFLSQLKPPSPGYPDHQHLISQKLETDIRHQHGSLAQLKSAFSAAAMGLFTNGWVWFVTDISGNTAVVPTFGPGSLLMRSRAYMAHSKDLELGFGLGQLTRGDPLPPDDPYHGEWKGNLTERNNEAANSRSYSAPTSKSPPPPGTTPSSPASAVSSSQPQNPTIPPHTRSLHTSPVLRNDEDDVVLNYSRGAASLTEDPQVSTRAKTKSHTDVLTMGETLYPLFCISVNEHAWMSAGYGVWGKEEWLKKFWTVLDWEKVSRSYVHYVVEGKH